jgi:hypothetical protein
LHDYFEGILGILEWRVRQLLVLARLLEICGLIWKGEAIGETGHEEEFIIGVIS